MTQKMYQWILKIGVFASFISLFLVNKNYLFPYITSKQLYFNILVEILLVFWAALIFKYPEWRPKKSYISWGLIAFFAALFLTCFTGVDFNLSFWGDIERMLGVYHLLHFLAFYFIIITAFRNRQDWWSLKLASVVAATAVAAYPMIYGGRPYATLGNTAYISGYIIFNLYFAALLFVDTFKTITYSKISGKAAMPTNREALMVWIERVFYVIAAFIMLKTFVAANTTGALVGLVFSTGVVLFLLTILTRNKIMRIVGISAMSIFVIAVVFVAMTRNTLLLNTRIGHMARDVSSQKVTFQTRLISWKAAAQDFPNHPLLGTGYGNYAITFDKFFDPKFYNYTRAETYFDHAHNNIVDITTTTGIIGLVTYLAIFVAVAYYLIIGYRRGKVSLNEFILLTGLITGYFIQNLAVFDSLATYFSLMITLGFIYWLLNWEGGEKFAHDRALDNREIYAFTIVGIIMATLIYQYGYKVDQMLSWTIQGQIAWNQNRAADTVTAYRKALSYGTPLDRDSRSSFIRLFSGGASALKTLPSDQVKDVLDFATELSKENLALNAHDSLEQMQYAQLLMSAAEYYYTVDQDKMKYYNDLAMEAINKSLDASPGRIPVYYVKAQIYLAMGDKEKALETLRYAADLNPDYYDSFCQLGNVLLYYKDEKGGYESMDQCIDKGGVSLLSPDGYVKSLIGHYAGAKDWDKVILLYERLRDLTPNDANVYADLAKLYAQVGRNDDAKTAALKAAELRPEFKADVDAFIEQLGK